MSFLISAGIFGDGLGAEDLEARYDFSQEDGVIPVTDQTSNGNNLGTGGYTGVGVSINGVQAGEFDGVDDYAGTSFTSVSQPFTIALAIEVISIDTNINNRFFDGATSDVAANYIRFENQNLTASSGTELISNTAPTAGDIIVYTVTFDGGSTTIRANGNQIASGNAGTSSLDGVMLGASDLSSPFDFGNYKIGEVLVYQNDKSAIIENIESYLTDKWGPTSTL